MTVTGARVSTDSPAGSAAQPSGLDGLLVEARRSVAKWVTAAAEAGTATGSDESGAVAAEVDGAGRVTRVVVAEDWRRLLGVDGSVSVGDLGAAVVAAAAAANVARLARWATSLSRAAVAGVDSVESASAAVRAACSVAALSAGGGIERAMSPKVRRSIAELADLTLRVWAEVDSIASPPDELDTPVLVREQVTGGGLVEVAVVAAHLSSVRTDEVRPDARGQWIGTAITSALSSAYRESDRTFSDPRTLPAAAELRDRLADPAAFLASLGLGPPPVAVGRRADSPAMRGAGSR